MSCVNATVEVLDNPAPFLNPFQFKIRVECIKELEEDVEWKVVYVGSASDNQYDQELDSVMVGPMHVGLMEFVLAVDPPDYTKIPKDDILGVTVVLLQCLYRGKQFLRVGYYVQNEYAEAYPELRLEPPTTVEVDKVMRHILAEKPRVTRFPIPWDEPAPMMGNGTYEGNSTSNHAPEDMQNMNNNNNNNDIGSSSISTSNNNNNNNDDHMEPSSHSSEPMELPPHT
eukprot:TRINITY_DN10277_c0_g1_i1.p1 TRINITY_DN10277_c0_g1~~TRINITY_DN10277_c0_g1_i1.p1  ORF type:complete len:227 (-),score=47.96 TRINITY_DN10277_c0_g1_i1:60-740(-)